MHKHEGSVLPPHALLGHEVSGIVDEIGPQVNSIDIGDHVVLISDSCPTCVRCTAGDPAYNHETPVTLDTLWANFSEPGGISGELSFSNGQRPRSKTPVQVVVDAHYVVKVDQTLPLHILGPLGCSIQVGAGAVINVLRRGRPKYCCLRPRHSGAECRDGSEGSRVRTHHRDRLFSGSTEARGRGGCHRHTRPEHVRQQGVGSGGP
ncbi:alcohol dehydrogenase catalytic domain-containing protein (plasmid) [Rhodococcus opacus]|uniref:alcohol dehydrogenase catalytic domain-containing protein n=1 Tax=Rhodococcus opacus TaxID=37919 RepID=UPI0034D25330|nr:alcohol dehydrogenase catalytic domain-containing protein [Rhodococcus opacus]